MLEIKQDTGQELNQGWFLPVSNSQRLEPVSYTHLDVYKRQPLRGMVLVIFIQGYPNIRLQGIRKI